MTLRIPGISLEYGDHDFLEANIDEETRLALTELAVFESLRTTHVRGPATYGSEVCELSERAYNHLKEYTEKAIAAVSPGA